MIEGGGSSRITVLLTNMAPRKLDPEEWPILVQTPEEQAPAQHLIVRTNSALPDGGGAVVYGHKGAGMGVVGAGLYAGEYHNRIDYDHIATAIFQVGDALGLDRKQLWVLVQQLPSRSV